VATSAHQYPESAEAKLGWDVTRKATQIAAATMANDVDQRSKMDQPEEMRVMRPNVRVKRLPAVWRLGRVDDDKQHGHAAKATRRWRSA